MKYKFIDLSAGTGGLSGDFIRAGYELIAHIEMDHYACDSSETRVVFHYLKENGKLEIYEEYLKNRKEEIDGSWLWDQVPKSVIDSIIQEAIGKETLPGLFERVNKLCNGKSADMIIGGPPCQMYSVANRARLGKKIEENPRDDLYKFYVEFLKRYKPRVFMLENALGIFTAKGREPFRDLIRLARKLDYNIDFHEQIASQHGVLWKCHRVIIAGWQNKRDAQGDTSYHYLYLLGEQMPHKMMRDLSCDLPIVKTEGSTFYGIIHYTKPLSDMKYLRKSGIRGVLSFTTQRIACPGNPTDREIYKQAVEQWNEGKRLRYDRLGPSLQKHRNIQAFLDRFCVVSPNDVCHTVVIYIAMDGHYYIYPIPNPTTNSVHSITIREAARVQSFPDDYFFEGSRSSAFKQTDNAVFVVLVEKVTLEIKEILTHEGELRRTQNR